MSETEPDVVASINQDRCPDNRQKQPRQIEQGWLPPHLQTSPIGGFLFCHRNLKIKYQETVLAQYHDDYDRQQKHLRNVSQLILFTHPVLPWLEIIILIISFQLQNHPQFFHFGA